jgi:hypothetical protein
MSRAPAAALGALGLALLLGCNGSPKPATPGTSTPSAAPASAPATQAASAPASTAPVPSTGSADQLMALDAGNTALDAGQNEQALAHFRVALTGPVNGAWISAGLAAAGLLEKPAPGEARALYLRLTEVAPIPEVHFAAGRFHGGQGDAPKAAEALQRAIELEPDFLPAYPLLGGLLVQTGREAEAAPLMLKYEQRLQRATRRLGDPALGLDARLAIVELFGVVDDERTLSALIDALGANKPELRTAAAGALMELGEPTAVQALAKAALAETHPMAKQLMIAALRRARDVLKTTPTQAQ